MKTRKDEKEEREARRPRVESQPAQDSFSSSAHCSRVCLLALCAHLVACRLHSPETASSRGVSNTPALLLLAHLSGPSAALCTGRRHCLGRAGAPFTSPSASALAAGALAASVCSIRSSHVRPPGRHPRGSLATRAETPALSCRDGAAWHRKFDCIPRLRYKSSSSAGNKRPPPSPRRPGRKREREGHESKGGGEGRGESGEGKRRADEASTQSVSSPISRSFWRECSLLSSERSSRWMLALRPAMTLCVGQDVKSTTRRQCVGPRQRGRLASERRNSRRRTGACAPLPRVSRACARGSSGGGGGGPWSPQRAGRREPPQGRGGCARRSVGRSGSALVRRRRKGVERAHLVRLFVEARVVLGRLVAANDVVVVLRREREAST